MNIYNINSDTNVVLSHLAWKLYTRSRINRSYKNLNFEKTLALFFL